MIVTFHVLQEFSCYEAKIEESERGKEGGGKEEEEGRREEGRRKRREGGRRRNIYSMSGVLRTY